MSKEQEQPIRNGAFGSKYSKSVTRVGLDFAAVHLVTAAEMTRAFLVNPKAFGEVFEESYSGPNEPLLSPENPFFNVLQNSGDFYDAFILSAVGYNTIGLADVLQSRLTKKQLSVKYKQAAGMFFSIGIVSIVEMGLYSGQTTADINDIPAGVAGAATYVIWNILSRKMAGKMVDSQVLRREDASE